jgi:hypothetical protein
VAILGKVKDGDELTFFSIRKAILSTEDLLDKYIVNFDDLSSLILKSEVDVLF